MNTKPQPDTNSSSQTPHEFINVLTESGFKEVLKIPIDSSENFFVFWRPGLLITLDTFIGRVNRAMLYFNFCGQRSAIHGSSAFVADTDQGRVYSGSTDIRNGLRYKLGDMLEVGTLLEKWVERPFLWLLHYEDTKAAGYKFDDINAERIALLPENVREAISGMNHTKE